MGIAKPTARRRPKGSGFGVRGLDFVAEPFASSLKCNRRGAVGGLSALDLADSAAAEELPLAPQVVVRQSSALNPEP